MIVLYYIVDYNILVVKRKIISMYFIFIILKLILLLSIVEYVYVKYLLMGIFVYIDVYVYDCIM